MAAKCINCRNPYCLVCAYITLLLIISLLFAEKQALERATSLLVDDTTINRNVKSKQAFLASSRNSPTNYNKKRRLPSLRNGGVVVFFHNPKTGGTSIREWMQRSPSDIHFVTRQKTSILQVYSYMEEWTTSTATKSSTIHFLEIHGESPGFMELLPKLHSWKQQAATHNVPIFYFTMMRDPLDWLLSCFNFFCLSLRKHTKCTSPPTTQGLLEEARPNPQSRWFCFMNTIMAVPNQVEVDMSHCQLEILLDALVETMDWVGFMENYGETLTVLQHVLPRNLTTAFKKRNQTRRKDVTRNMLNHTTTAYLQDFMNQDYDLYRRLQQEYRLTKMELPNRQDA